MRVLSGLMVIATVAVFLLPSTIAIYAAVNGTAWDLQDLQDLPLIELLVPVAALFALASPPAGIVFAALRHEVTHALTSGVPLFELECALIR
ncbi:MAG: hypothetical protein LAN37_12430 [Acidobacteriia bacterium]|nr:hypothetical protein [Terriglobia bacterium]